MVHLQFATCTNLLEGPKNVGPLDHLNTNYSKCDIQQFNAGSLAWTIVAPSNPVPAYYISRSREVWKTRWKPWTRKLTRLFRPYLGRNTPRGSVGVTFLVRHAWMTQLVRVSWCQSIGGTLFVRRAGYDLAQTLLVRRSWSHTLCNTLLGRYFCQTLFEWHSC